jgi:hypothetical protein
MPVVSPQPPSPSLLLSESNIPALPLDIVTAPQSPPESESTASHRGIHTNVPIPAPVQVTPATQTQDEHSVQILTSPPSPVSNPSSALPSPSPIIIPPTPERQHEPQASTSTTASQPPPQPRQSQSTFRHVRPSSIAGGRPYTHSPLRPAHRDTLPPTPAGPSTPPGTAANVTVFRTISPSAGSTPVVLSPSPHALSPRIFTLSQQTRTSSPLAPCNVTAPVNNGSLPVIPISIAQRGVTATSATISSRLASPAPSASAGAPSFSSSSHTMEAPQPPSKGLTPSPTPSTSQKLLPQTPPSRPASLPRHPGHTPTHSESLLVHLPPSAPASRSATPVPTPPQRAGGNAPYRAGFQPKGVYRSHTDEFLESRARKRESGRVEQRRLERRLDKVCSNRHTRTSFRRYRCGDTDLFLFLFLFHFILLLHCISSSSCTSRILRQRLEAQKNTRSHQCRHLHDALPVSLILTLAA